MTGARRYRKMSDSDDEDFYLKKEYYEALDLIEKKVKELDSDLASYMWEDMMTHLDNNCDEILSYFPDEPYSYTSPYNDEIRVKMREAISSISPLVAHLYAACEEYIDEDSYYEDEFIEGYNNSKK